ncbi:MAG: 2-oxoacid:ferredoxin oxidoreductase subunit beta, partial [Candidatus Eiseniibacteriota bacterium]
DYDPSDREGAMRAIHEARREQKFVTGLLYVDESKPSLGEELHMPKQSLAGLPIDKARPPREVLDSIMESLRTGR